MNEETPQNQEHGQAQKIEREGKQVVQVYSALCAAILLSFVPLAAAQIIAVPLMIFSFVGAYYYRLRSQKDDLTHNHMVYLIRTFWMSGGLFFIGMAGVGYYLGSQMDAMRILSALEPLMRGEIVMSDDLRQVLTAALVSFAPSIVYFVYRLAKALPRAINGYRMPNPRSWL